MSKSRVDLLHVIGSFVAAGAERFVVDMALALNELGYRVGVVALSAKTDDVGRGMRAALEDAGVLHDAGPTRPVRFRSAAWYARTLGRLNPKLVHLHTPNTDLAHYLGRFRWRQSHALFRTLHNTNIPDSRRYWHAIRSNPVSASIACGSAVREAMASRVPGPIEVIPNGIRFDWPVRTEKTRADSAARLGLAPECRHYVCVGRMGGQEASSAAKAHDVLIRAWREADAGARGAHLHLLGDGELRPALETLADGDDSVHFHGVVSGVHDWLVGADGFLMPSRHEGLPIAGIEALATGLPCIFSTIPPLRELAPASVRWVAPNDVSGLSAQLSESIDAPREYLPDAANEVREAYGISAVARRYIDCYTTHGAEHFSRGVAT